MHLLHVYLQETHLNPFIFILILLLLMEVDVC